MRSLLILISIIVIATVAHAYSTGDWMCASGACTLGATTTASTQIHGGAESLSIGASNDTFLFTVDSTDTVTLIGADAAGATNLLLDTTGAGAITIGSADVTGLTVTTDGAALNLEGTTAETLTLTATTTSTAVFQGADAAGASNTTFDTTGAGAIIVGSADVTSVAVTTDGGTVTLDGSVLGKQPVVSLASGALTLNTIHLATAAADYDIPDLACDAAGDVGNWVTVVMEDASTVISITSDDASNIIYVPGLGLGAGDELDSTSTAANEGSHITLTCMAAEGWYATSMSAISGGVIAWADGGAAD